MAFRTALTPAQGLISLKSQAIAARSYAISQRDLMAAANISANALKQTMSNFKSFIEFLDTVAAIPGIVQYARDQEDDQTYDVVAEFNAMRAAAVGVRDRIVNDVPQAASGHVSVEVWEVDGSITVTAFTPAQTLNLRNDLDVLINSILV